MSPQASPAEPGLVVWITGLPCSGKSTLARALAGRIRAHDPRCVVLDGDELRKVLAEDLGYTLDERRRCGWRYARLAALLAGQGLQVVVATVSMFEEIRRWNRAHAQHYFEIHLRVGERARRARDRHDLYARTNVVGVDLPYEEPANPDLVVADDGVLEPGEVERHAWHALVAWRAAAARSATT